MGYMLHASCSCCYTGNASVGGGLLGGWYFPGACWTCKRVITLDLEAELRCPTCNGPALSYEDEVLSSEAGTEVHCEERGFDKPPLQIKAAPYLCPACEKHRMHFSNVGIWD